MRTPGFELDKTLDFGIVSTYQPNKNPRPRGLGFFMSLEVIPET